jgi:protein-S-isoprenylcysteine O-methyltransferase Ste14
LKEVCHVGRFFVRWKGAICNHLFCALRAFLKLEQRRSGGQITTWYQLKRHVADQAVTTFIHQMVKHPHSA